MSVLQWRRYHFSNIQKMRNFNLAERWERWLLWLIISSAQTFCFCNSNVATFHTYRKCKHFNFFPLDCASRNAVSSKFFNEFSKTFFWLKDDEGGYFGWKFQVHRHLAFAIASLLLFQHAENVKISIFPFRLSEQKCCIFKSI